MCSLDFLGHHSGLEEKELQAVATAEVKLEDLTLNVTGDTLRVYLQDEESTAVKCMNRKQNGGSQRTGKGWGQWIEAQVYRKESFWTCYIGM